MSAETMDLYLIQSPVVLPDDDNLRGYNRDLLKAYKNSIPVRDIGDFISRILMEVMKRHRLIKKLVIGSHGTGLPTGYGLFYIGRDKIQTGEGWWEGKYVEIGEAERQRLDCLRVLAPVFARDADVYVMACKTGNDGALLRKVSQALGGVRVHGYTDYITTTNYWLSVSVDDGTDDGGKEIVCWPSECRDFSYRNPRTLEHPQWRRGKDREYYSAPRSFR
jgi:hypothetical protein